MATAAQIAANRKNAARSTGPRTESGKKSSARNAVSHGLCSSEFVVRAGEEDYFQQFFAGLESDLQPQSPIEHELFLQVAHAAWTLRRCHAVEPTLSQSPEVDPLAVAKNVAALKVIDTYIRRAERTFHRALKELRAIQSERRFRAEACPNSATIQDDSPLVSYREFLKPARTQAAQGRTEEVEKFRRHLNSLLSLPPDFEPDPIMPPSPGKSRTQSE